MNTGARPSAIGNGHARVGTITNTFVVFEKAPEIALSADSGNWSDAKGYFRAQTALKNLETTNNIKQTCL